MARIIVIGGLAESLVNFRGHFIRSLCLRDHDVIAMAPKPALGFDKKLKTMNATYIDYPLKRTGLNPYNDFVTWFSLRSIFKAKQPDIIFAYTIKPVIWGGLASRVLKQNRFYALITGLGFAFSNNGKLSRKLLTFAVSFLYKWSLSGAEKVIFQNPDNLQEFVSRKIVPREKCELVAGSGIDTEVFSFKPLPIQATVTFLTICRLLNEKGLREYVDAAKIIKKQFPDTEFQILGTPDTSPDGISMQDIEKWHKNKWINYLGAAEDVKPYLQDCHIYVLASYHEGMPRTVLEAMSMGRPILTTDVPGCRETVVTGENGFLVNKEDSDALAERMIWFINNRQHWEKMGIQSRNYARERYDVNDVNTKLFSIINLDKPPVSSEVI